MATETFDQNNLMWYYLDIGEGNNIVIYVYNSTLSSSAMNISYQLSPVVVKDIKIPLWGIHFSDNTILQFNNPNLFTDSIYTGPLSDNINLKVYGQQLGSTRGQYYPPFFYDKTISYSFNMGDSNSSMWGSTSTFGFCSTLLVKTTDNEYYNIVPYSTGGSGPSIDRISNIKAPTTNKKGSAVLNGSLASVSNIWWNPQQVTSLALIILGKAKNFDPVDPNPGGGDSTGGGGGGDGDIGGSPHETGTLPTITALDSGLMTLYNPTVSELQSLGRFLWSDTFSLDTFKKLFNDPFDTLLGLSIVPVKPNVSGTHNIIFGNLDSGISSSIIGNQFVDIDCGTLTLNEVWKGALDYSPYTEVSIYLPFIGVRQLNCNDVMGSILHLYYHFDVLTGSVIAEITINHSAQGNKSNGFSYNADMGSVYTFEGQCSLNIPLSSQDFTNTIRAAIGAVGMVAGAAASFAAGNPALGVAALAVGSANAVTQSMTPTVERSGHLSSSASMMASLEPCLFVTRQHQCKPQRYYALRGVPSQVYVSKLSSCTGFFQVSDIQNIHASGASDVELQELKQILTQGVFVDSWKGVEVTT